MSIRQVQEADLKFEAPRPQVQYSEMKLSCRRKLASRCFLKFSVKTGVNEIELDAKLTSKIATFRLPTPALEPGISGLLGMNKFSLTWSLA